MLIKTIKSLLFCFLFTFVITHPTYSSPNPTYIRNSDDIPFFPEAIIKINNNDLIFVDSYNHSVKKLTGKVKETLPNSNYPQGGFKDGTRLEAEFNFPKVLDINEDGFILISDSLNNAIRLIDPSGIVTSPFADHTLSFPLETPRGVLMLEDKIYISDFTNGIIELPINIKTYESKDIEVIINKEPISYGSFSAFMELNNIYLPLGETLKKLNYRVTWNPLDKSILCSRNTSNLKLDTSDFKIIDGKSYISTKTLKATFLLDLTYDLVNKKVTIEGGI